MASTGHRRSIFGKKPKEAATNDTAEVPEVAALMAMAQAERAKRLTDQAADSRKGVRREGWLWKRGKINRSWKKRFCVLLGDRLEYYEVEPALTTKVYSPKGTIPLSEFSEVLADTDKAEKGYQFEVRADVEDPKARKFHLAAPTEEERRQWIESILEVVNPRQEHLGHNDTTEEQKARQLLRERHETVLQQKTIEKVTNEVALEVQRERASSAEQRLTAVNENERPADWNAFMAAPPAEVVAQQDLATPAQGQAQDLGTYAELVALRRLVKDLKAKKAAAASKQPGVKITEDEGEYVVVDTEGSNHKKKKKPAKASKAIRKGKEGASPTSASQSATVPATAADATAADAAAVVTVHAHKAAAGPARDLTKAAAGITEGYRYGDLLVDFDVGFCEWLETTCGHYWEKATRSTDKGSVKGTVATVCSSRTPHFVRLPTKEKVQAWLKDRGVEGSPIEENVGDPNGGPQECWWLDYSEGAFSMPHTDFDYSRGTWISLVAVLRGEGEKLHVQCPGGSITSVGSRRGAVVVFPSGHVHWTDPTVVGGRRVFVCHFQVPGEKWPDDPSQALLAKGATMQVGMLA